MKNNIITIVLSVFVLALLSGCASIRTWPDDERSAEHKMVAIQERIGEGLKTGALTPDQSQMFLSTLKAIRTDYLELRDKKVPREEWKKLHGRLDLLEEDIHRASVRPATLEEPRSGDRIAMLQRRIDDGRVSGRLPLAEEKGFQARLDAIRRDYMRIMEGGRSVTSEERADISRRLDSLSTDMNRIL